MKIDVRDLSYSIGPARIIDSVSMHITDGECAAIVGPNGSGKTTLLRLMLSIVKASNGTIEFDGQSVGAYNSKELSQLRSSVPQSTTINSGLTVLNIIELAQLKQTLLWSNAESKKEKALKDQAIQEAISITGVGGLLDRQIDSLSGGEKQKVLIARAIAQNTPIILLDEPTNHLDPSARIEILEIIRALKKTRVVVLHDLDLALSYADRVFVMSDGQIPLSGRPEEVFQMEEFQRIFSIRTKLVQSPFKEGSNNLITGKLVV